MGRHWLELNKLRPRVKRAVDTKASKGAGFGYRAAKAIPHLTILLLRGPLPGRKLRYDVQAKLLNFMAPNPQVFPYPEAAKDDLFRSLFAPIVASM